MKNETKKLEYPVACSLATQVAIIAFFFVLLSGPFFVNTHTCTFVCVSPKDCYATGRGLKAAVVGQRAYAVLYMIDNRGSAYTGEVKTVTCEVINQSTDEKSECVTKKTKRDQYRISYQATSLGRHQLHIKVEGEHIKGSPFSVTIIRKLGTPIQTIKGMTLPCGMVVNQTGDILVAEWKEHRISIFSPSGKKVKSFGSQGSKKGDFDDIHGLAMDDDGNILVADCSNHRIQKFSSEQMFITSVGSQGSKSLQFNCPYSVAISPTTKKIAIPDMENDRVQILNPDLTFHKSISSWNSGNGSFDYPRDVAFDGAGYMYVVDSNNNCIQVFTPEGEFLRQFGKRGKGDGELNYPTGICIDSYDRVYVVEYFNHRVSVFTRKGIFLTSFGRKGDGPGQFSGPDGITVDRNGIIYVSDTYNNRIQIF